MRPWVLAGICVCVAGGCGKPDSDSTSSGGTGSTVASGDTAAGDAGGGDGGSTTLEEPAATILSARCTLRSTGDTYVGWTVEGTASDPQGADTLRAVVDDGVVVAEDGHRAASAPIAGQAE